MNKARRIYQWIIISILFQVVLLMYVNNIYLSRRGEAKTTLIDTKYEAPKKDIKVEIPQSAANIRVSYDNYFVSYMSNGNLEILDVKEKKVVKTISYSSEEITYYRWLPDRNMVIYAIKAPDNQAGKTQVLTYNVDSEVEHAYPQITGVPAKSRITAIELSPLTNVIYAKVVTGSETAKIYKYNIESTLSFAFNTNGNTIIKEMNYDNKMVYQDEKNKLYLWDGHASTSKMLAYKEKLVLFSVVGLDDEVYVGELNAEGKVDILRYGTVDQKIEDWNEIDLKTPVLPESIIITAEGNVFERNEEKNMVYNLRNNDKISYEGTFVEIFGKHIVTRDEKLLKIKSIN